VIQKPSRLFIWILIGVAVAVFCRANYKVSHQLAVVKAEFAEAKLIREEQVAIQARAVLLEQRTTEHYWRMFWSERSLNETFNVGPRDSMASKLNEQFEVPLGAKFLLARVEGGDRFAVIGVSEAKDQTLVMYAKVFPEKQKGAQLELFNNPDHRIEFPLPCGQLLDLKCSLPNTESGVELFLQLGKQERKKIPFDGFSSLKSADMGYFGVPIEPNHLSFDRRTVFGSAKNVNYQAVFFEKGIWCLVSIRMHQLKPVNGGKEKELHVAIVLESPGPFFVSPLKKQNLANDFVLTWDEAEAAYLVELKSNSNSK